MTTPRSSVDITQSQRSAFGAWQRGPWQWMASLTLDTHSYVAPLVLLQIAYVVSVGLIFAAGLFDSVVDRWLLYVWLAESAANLVVRISLLEWMRRKSLTDLLTNRLWRFVPLTTGILQGSHWAWTAMLFVNADLGAVALTALASFVLMSMAAVAIMPTSRVAALIILTSIWVPTAVQLWSVPYLRDGASIGILLLSIVTVLSTSLYLSIRHVRRYLDKSDEVIRLVDELWASNAELERMRTQAATELQNRSQFFNGASHDFAQRLHGLKLLAHAAQSEGSTSAPGKIVEALEDLEAYVRNILEFGRLESSTLSPSFRSVRLQDVFQTILLHFESIAEARGVDLKIRTTGAIVETDEAMLLRVLENLVSNAIKFTRGRVLVAARRRAHGWAIQVWDQGPGVPVGSEAAIFRAFYQHSAHVDRRREGVGLGLAIVDRLASSLNYSVTVDSRQHRGTVMTIRGLRAASLPLR